MAIARINEFEAREGKSADLRELLMSVVQNIKSSPGCRTCQLLQDTHYAGRFAIYEVWDDEASHRAATHTVPPATMQRAMALLAGPPKSAYYRLEAEG
ncbi:MAG: putative quinol monooxygenase [Alphaproteobacteria bacterium]